MRPAANAARPQRTGRERARDPCVRKLDVGQGASLAKIEAQGANGPEAWVRFRSEAPIVKAELLYTEAEGAWQNRKWQTLPGRIDVAAKTATATLPPNVTVYYLNLIDVRELIVSTEHVEVRRKG